MNALSDAMVDTALVQFASQANKMDSQEFLHFVKVLRVEKHVLYPFYKSMNIVVCDVCDRWREQCRSCCFGC